MIKDLYVNDLAIIEDVHLNFEPQMTVLTGQTGAGKSLIIDSISLLLGARADQDLIRYNSNKAIVRGCFDYQNEKIDEVLKKYGIPKKDNLEIKREISLNGKNSIKVNDEAVNLNQLKELTSYLADIHTQHDAFRLINPDNYLNIIDSFDEKIGIMNNDYQVAFFEYKDVINKYQMALKNKDIINEKIDLLKFQYEELKSLGAHENEDVEIEEEISKLENYDKIYSSLNEAYQFLNNSTMDNLYNALSQLEKIKEYSLAYNEKCDIIKDTYYNAVDVMESIKKEINTLDFDPMYLDNLNMRIQDIKKIEKKYQKGINDLIMYQNKIEEEIKRHEDYDGYLQDCYDLVTIKHEKLSVIAYKVLKRRKEVAKELEKCLIKECHDLDLKDIKFKIDFKEKNISNPLEIDSFSSNGIANVDFLISLNYGEPEKSLFKVASGGEMSRIMLGFKSILVSKQKLSFIVFDEIDSGVSGITASKIAKKIKGIADHTQVLCITHLPHVAAIANNQINIYKTLEDGRTKTYTNMLSFDERVKEIAIMISGEHLTSGALISAKELLSNN